MNRTLSLRKIGEEHHLLVGWLLHPVSLITLFLLSLMAALCAAEVQPPSEAGTPQVTFDNLEPGQEAQAMEVYEAARAHFARLTGKQVGAAPVHICIVDHLAHGENSRTAGQTLGVTVFVDGRNVIQISSAQTRSFGRVLAHELTHAFVREAYGRAENRALSEGIAEYVAAQLFGAEVNRDIHAAASALVRNPRLVPYVSGYNFCLHHASRPGFGAFFESQIKMPDFGFGHLETVWKRMEHQA